MVRLPPKSFFPIPMTFPMNSMALQRCFSPWLGVTFAHLAHDESNTKNEFLTSLGDHRNKPHSIWSPDAPGIDSNIFALVMFVVLTDYLPEQWTKPKQAFVLVEHFAHTHSSQQTVCPNSPPVHSSSPTCKIHRKFSLNPKVMKQDLLCYLEYSLSPKHEFDTKVILKIWTKKLDAFLFVK